MSNGEKHGWVVRGSPGATVLGVVAIGLWSTMIACSRSVTEQLGTVTAAAVIYLAAGVLGCGVLAVTGRLGPLLRKVDRRYLWGCGGLMAAYTGLLYLAIGQAQTREQVITVTVANYLWPSLTLMFAGPLLGWKARPIGLAVGTVLAWAGVALAVGVGEMEMRSAHGTEWWEQAAPTGLAMLAAVAWGLYSNLSRRWGSAVEVGAMPVFLLGTGGLLLVIRLFCEEETVWTGRVLFETGYLVLFPTLLAYVFWDAAARRGNLSLVSVLSYATPLLSVGVSGVYLGVPITPGQWLAGGLVVVGAVICKRAVAPPEAQRGGPSGQAKRP